MNLHKKHEMKKRDNLIHPYIKFLIWKEIVHEEEMIVIGNHDFDPFPDRPSYHLRYINKHGEAIDNGHVGLVNETTVISR